MNSLQNTIRKNSVISGLLLGLILTAIGIFSFYFITQMADTPVLFIAGPTIIKVMLPIVVVIFFCFDARKRIGGYWTFRQATTAIFIMFMVAYIVQSIGQDVIFPRIEKDVPAKTEKAYIDASESFKSKPGANAKQIDQNIADIKKSFSDQKAATAGSIVQGIVFSIILVFVLSMIFAALFKRDPPLYTKAVDVE